MHSKILTTLTMFLLTLVSFRALAFDQSPPKQTITWKGHEWRVANAKMAGVVPGSGDNVFVDSKGFLHLKVVRQGDTWTAAEIFTFDHMSFGTYQWQIEGAVDEFDPALVLGLFTFSPIDPGGGVPGENEVDIEFSRWNNPKGPNASFTIWPPTGFMKTDPNGDLVPAHENHFQLRLPKPKLVTARTTWSPDQVTSTVLLGLQPPSSQSHVIHQHVYKPADPKTKIPQVSAALGINLWCFEHAPKKEQEIIIHDFTYVPTAP